MPDETLRGLADEYWDVLLQANPTSATLLGDHRFDDRIEDFSALAEAELRGRLASVLGRAASRWPTARSCTPPSSPTTPPSTCLPRRSTASGWRR